MGYRTNYTIKVEPEDRRDLVLTRLGEVSGYWTGSSPNPEEIKWYDHAADTVQVSREFPDVLITLSGIGEEPGDVWCMYVRNGKSVRHRQGQFVPPPPPLDMKVGPR